MASESPSRRSSQTSRVRFEEVAWMLREMNLGRLREEATDAGRRVLPEELLDAIAMYPLEVTVQTRSTAQRDTRRAGFGLGGVEVLSCRRGDLNPHPL